MKRADIEFIVSRALAMRSLDDRIYTEELMMDIWDDESSENEDSKREIKILNTKIEEIAAELKNFLE